jgi:hypothetical protein
MLCAWAYIMKKRERQVISCFRVEQICKGKKKKMRKKMYIDNSELFMHERHWFFFLYTRTPYFFLHSPRLAPYICVCACVSNDAMQNAIDERATRIWSERENDGAVPCSSCGTNLIPLRFFSLSLLIANADAFLSLSLSDISSSSRARPTLTYREKSAYTHTHSHTHWNARSCVDPHIYKKKMT